MKINKVFLILLVLASSLAVYFVVSAPKKIDENVTSMNEVTTQKRLQYFTTNYYKDQRTDLVASALLFIDGNSIMEERRAFGPLMAFFNRIFHDNPKLNAQWAEELKKAKVSVRVAFLKSMNLSEAKLLEEYSLSPMKIDMYWALFFASGELNYVDKVLSSLPLYAQEKDAIGFLAAGSAKWTLALNARNHTIIAQYLEKIKKDASSPYQKYMEEILSIEPKVIHEAVMEKVNNNKEKGIW